MAYLVLVRHGQSEWNLLNKFTGWVDVELTEEGRAEARKAASLLNDISLHRAYTSDLKRAIDTLAIILEETAQKHVPVVRDKALRERHYGDFVGMNKEEVRAKYGDEYFKSFRRGWNVAPPGGESLKDTSKRVIPYFQDQVLKDLKRGHNVIIAAHGNSLRAIIKHLEDISDTDIAKVEIGTGTVFVYRIDEQHGTLTSVEIRNYRDKSPVLKSGITPKN